MDYGLICNLSYFYLCVLINCKNSQINNFNYISDYENYLEWNLNDYVLSRVKSEWLYVNPSKEEKKSQSYSCSLISGLIKGTV